jgi:uncharacterized protein YukE
VTKLTITARPPDFEPLASSDPVPADIDETAALGRRYTDTAAEIETQAAKLKALASNTIDGWTGQAAKVFQSHAADLSTRISQAQERYSVAGHALTKCSASMQAAQQDAYAAVWQAKAAQDEMTSNQPLPPLLVGSPTPTTDEVGAARRQANFEEASASLALARRQFDTAVGDYHAAARGAAQAIEAEINHDGLKDSWWDRNFGWISEVMTVFAVVVAVLAVVALLLICPWTAVLIAELLTGGLGLLGTGAVTATAAISFGSSLGYVVAGLTAVSAMYDGIAAGTGKESWTSFDIDIASLATFGIGEGAGAILKVLADGAEGVGKAVAATRAGCAFMADQGMPRWAYSLSSRTGAVGKAVMGLLGKGDVLTGAVHAASAAREGIEAAVKAVEPGNLVSAWTMNNDVAADFGKLRVLNGKVPGVIRIMVPQAVGRAVVAADGLVQWSGMALGDTWDAWTVAHWNQSDSAAIDQTIGQFRHLISQVPAR